MARQQALVIGGTGPTGPFVVEGLHDRGYEVTILHGGQHEYEFAVPGVRHIHEDPHFEETLERGLGGATFDLVVAQYGRLRVIAEVLRGRTERLVAVGGATGIFAPDDDPRWGAAGKPALFPDTSTIYVADAGPDSAHKLGLRMVEAMTSLFEHHAAGAYSATYVGYPVNYGPRTPGPYDWSVIRRVLDGRRRFVDRRRRPQDRQPRLHGQRGRGRPARRRQPRDRRRQALLGGRRERVHDAPADRVHRPPSRPRARARRHALRARVAVPPALAPRSRPPARRSAR